MDLPVSTPTQPSSGDGLYELVDDPAAPTAPPPSAVPIETSAPPAPAPEAAAKDPAKYDDAIGSWTEIRRRLDRTVSMPEPKSSREKERYRGLQASYYDAIYNTVACLLAQAKRLQTTDKAAAVQKAKTGEQVLTAVLQSHPKLDGTDGTIKRFAAIKAQLAAFRGGMPSH